jgi:hypothetical protein
MAAKDGRRAGVEFTLGVNRDVVSGVAPAKAALGVRQVWVVACGSNLAADDVVIILMWLLF